MSNKYQDLLGSKPCPASMLNVGYGNFVMAQRIVAILEAGSLPMKRLRETAATQNQLVDATAGRKMRSLIITSSQHVVLSALSPQALQERLCGPGRNTVSIEEIELREGQFAS